MDSKGRNDSRNNVDLDLSHLLEMSGDKLALLSHMLSRVRETSIHEKTPNQDLP